MADFMLKRVPAPAIGFDEKSLERIARDIKKLGKKSRRTAERGVTRFITKSAWQALLRGERVAALRVFSEDELKHHQFGNDPGKFIVRVKITSVTD